MLPKFEQFIKERQYLHNVSPATVSWHTHNLKWLQSETPTEDELKHVVLRMREKGRQFKSARPDQSITNFLT